MTGFFIIEIYIPRKPIRPPFVCPHTCTISWEFICPTAAPNDVRNHNWRSFWGPANQTGEQSVRPRTTSSISGVLQRKIESQSGKELPLLQCAQWRRTRYSRDGVFDCVWRRVPGKLNRRWVIYIITD